MKKILESRIVSLIITIIITTTISVFATTIISSNSVSYTNSKTNETTVEGSLNELFSAVDINNRLGNTDEISDIGDGTVSGAISTLNNEVSTLGTSVSNLELNFTTLYNDYHIINEVTAPYEGLYLLNNTANLYKTEGERCMLMTRVDRNGETITYVTTECGGDGPYKGAALSYSVNLLKDDKIYAIIYTDTSTSTGTSSLLQAIKMN